MKPKADQTLQNAVLDELDVEERTNPVCRERVSVEEGQRRAVRICRCGRMDEPSVARQGAGLSEVHERSYY